ncbi:XdhC family protein [Parasphingorhabdus sp.]|uniref:XdhC family protein n=1 Tax=Parasphingorhabdus sp. TaxID=2709688 RepID=UPI00326627DA
MDNRQIFSFLSKAVARNQRCVLVSVASVSGSSMRDPGAHMAISEDGKFTGSLSGGCIEAAVVAEALDVIRENEPRITRFGEGSAYLDIRLPCGGGLDIHFLPMTKSDLADRCLDAIRERKPFGLRLPVLGGEAAFVADGLETRFLRKDQIVEIGHQPVPRLLIIGHGAASTKVAELGTLMKMDVAFHSSDQNLVDEMHALGLAGDLLRTTRDTDQLTSDPWTAIIFMFHDHDWEGHLMAHMLKLPHFYFGAMGGRQAHATRIETLASLAVPNDQIERIHAPIGLFHSSRDPETLAMSILAEVTAKFHDIRLLESSRTDSSGNADQT